MSDVEPRAEHMRKAKADLQLAIDASADDEKIKTFTGALVVSMERFDEQLKLSKNCIPKTAKPKGSGKAKAKGPAA